MQFKFISVTLSKFQDLQREVADFQLPDLEAEYSDDEGDRLDVALDKYNDLRQSLAEVQVYNSFKYHLFIEIFFRPRPKLFACAGINLTKMSVS